MPSTSLLHFPSQPPSLASLMVHNDFYEKRMACPEKLGALPSLSWMSLDIQNYREHSKRSDKPCTRETRCIGTLFSTSRTYYVALRSNSSPQ